LLHEFLPLVDLIPSNGVNSTAELGHEPARLKRTLAELVTEMDALVARHAELLSSLDARRRQSAENLLHYLVLRRRDIRELQRSLSTLGLSSLGRCEHDVKVHVERVIALLDLMAGTGALQPSTRTGCHETPRILERNAENLLGPQPKDPGWHGPRPYQYGPR
jgi:pyruvate kinase